MVLEIVIAFFVIVAIVMFFADPLGAIGDMLIACGFAVIFWVGLILILMVLDALSG